MNILQKDSQAARSAMGVGPVRESFCNKAKFERLCVEISAVVDLAVSYLVGFNEISIVQCPYLKYLNLDFP